MAKHTHEFVETYDGLVGFGADRETDENTVMVFLQKFSDDRMLKTILPRLSDEALAKIFDCVGNLLRHHLSEDEYHHLFLKDDH
jgi:hypothetical protein